MALTISSITLAGATTVEGNPFGSTLTLPVGVYQLNYQYRFRSSSTTVISGLYINNPLATQQSGIRNYGLYLNYSLNVTVTGSSVTGAFCMGGSGIIVNTTPSNVLTPNVAITYTPAGSLSYSGGSDCYVALTRFG